MAKKEKQADTPSVQRDDALNKKGPATNVLVSSQSAFGGRFPGNA